MLKGTSAVVRQLIARGPLTKQNIRVIVRNCGNPFKWSELCWVAVRQRGMVILRTEAIILRKLKASQPIKMADFTPKQRIEVRMIHERLKLSIVQGMVTAGNCSTEYFLQKIYDEPGISLLQIAQSHTTAPETLALLCKSNQLTTYEGRVWASPGPPMNVELRAKWMAAHNATC